MNTYSVTTQAYCGMSIPHGSDYTYQEARARAKARIDYFKKVIGGAVVKLSTNSWELQEPENCCMVPDACGTLEITKGESRIQ